MSDLVFDFEWADPLGARGRELRATWARFAVRVGQHSLSRVLDHEVKTVRDSVYLPLYPVAEWVATNWWRLLFEIESSERASDPFYERRHNLKWAREGYSVPSVSFTAVGEFMQVHWEPEFLHHHRVEFLETGSALVTLEAVQRSLHGFVAMVADRLRALDITDTQLQREWDAIVNADADEVEFCIAAATLGLDPYDLDDVVALAIVAIAESLPPSVRREFFSVASQQELREQSTIVNQSIEQVRENGADLRSLRELRQSVPPAGSNGEAPWDQGYAAARVLRRDLHAGARPIRSFNDLAEVLRLESPQLSAAIIEQPQSTRAFEAIVGTNRVDSPAFTVNRRHDTARRFQVCRAIYEFLAGRDEGPWLVTTGLSDRQKRNRAFAAEFLAPASAIQDQIRSRIVSGAEVDELAQHFGVSSDAIVHQLRNHNIASVAW